jgi:ankyrin repeat protein
MNKKLQVLALILMGIVNIVVGMEKTDVELHAFAERRALAKKETRGINKFLQSNSINYKNERGETALHSVSTREGAWLLIKNDADINSRTKDGFTPLSYHVIRDNPEIVRLLLACNAIIDDSVKIAMSEMHDSTIDELLKHGCCACAPGLYTARKNGYVCSECFSTTRYIGEVLEADDKEGMKIIFKEAFFHPDRFEFCQMTPLFFALYYCRWNVVPVLLAAEANPNMTYNKNISALSLAMKNNAPMNIILALLEAGADVDVFYNNTELTCLEQAVVKTDIELVKWLLYYDAQVTNWLMSYLTKNPVSSDLHSIITYYAFKQVFR